MTTPDPTVLQEAIQKICTGPELSKDLSFEHARDAMQLILNGKANPVQSALFLIGLRMKRESDDEFKGIQYALNRHSTRITANVEEVICLSDPFNGFTRHLPASPFLPAVLAALGLPTISEGVITVAPKFGITHHAVLSAAGKSVNLNPEQAIRHIQNPDIGWSYLDQSQYCQGLHALLPLRTLMVKRPVIATCERMIGPVRGSLKTHLVSSYVHKAYPRIYRMLADYSGFTSSMFVKGVEGGIIPSLRDHSKMISCHAEQSEQMIPLNPSDSGAQCTERAQPIPNDLKDLIDADNPDKLSKYAQSAADAGLAALNGQHGYAYNSLVYGAATVLLHIGKYPTLAQAADAVRRVLVNGHAKARFDAG
ncbi:MAG: anthranilate phosphoribosyltransferase [Gammaproteobacteria bacterium]|nr:anthranilate phosphoribosyltransferase [Gammaproteobacteria bacterium]